MFNRWFNNITFSSTKSINNCSKWTSKSFKFVFITFKEENNFFLLIFYIDSLLINNEDNPNECDTNLNNNDGTTSTINGNSSLLCCVCQDRASGRHYGVLSCEVINNLFILFDFLYSRISYIGL
jgi:hypothetical protein